MSQRGSAALAELRDRGLRRTDQRGVVTQAVLRRKRPFTAQELVEELAPRGVGRATVFRTLDLLVRTGLLSRIHSVDAGERCARYTRCQPEHHHHLVCRSCGRVEEVAVEGLERQLAGVARGHDFDLLGHSLEIEGLCRSCR